VARDFLFPFKLLVSPCFYYNYEIFTKSEEIAPLIIQEAPPMPIPPRKRNRINRHPCSADGKK
jgi:hypothetical protein